jgi:non-ribosomal peptide synthase protein (TIGR01720 family)
VVAVADWCRRRGRGGSTAVLLDLEGHGREEEFEDVELSRTVGWFTSLFPVRLDPGAIDLDDAMAGGAVLGRALKTIKEQLRALPDHGLGYGLLRYLNPQTAAQLGSLARPQIAFNYLGRFGAAGGVEWAAAAEAPLGGGVDAALALAHCLEVNALTLDGADGPQLTAHWTFAPTLLSQAEVSDLAQRWFGALEALVRHAQTPGAGGRSPSDLPLLRLSQAEIERLECRYPQIEDILPLSPLQEGLLFHALYDVQAPDVYTVQLVLGLAGRLDVHALEAAVAALVARHSSLRAAFAHENLSRPVQIIVPPMMVPLRHLDLSLLDEAQRAERLGGILAQDRSARFDLGCPGLIRFTLVRLSAAEHRLVLTNHHILLDGWSMPVLVQELLTLYGHKGDGGVLARATPYRDYLAWIARQDRTAALAAWRDALAGLEEPTLMAPHARTRAPVAPQRMVLALSERLTAALSEAARRQGVTLNSMLQAAWALLLGRLLGREDVVFGVTVAGRAPELSGIESMVGLFINTLPSGWRRCRGSLDWASCSIP